MGINPDLITCDFSPVILAAIRQIFGEHVIQIDLFHVMQEINRGIRRDLLAYRNRQFDEERRELRSLRDWISSLQELMKTDEVCFSSIKKLEIPPKIEPSHELSMNCLLFTLNIIEVLKVDEPVDFFLKLRQFLKTLDLSIEPLSHFHDKISALMPKKRFTQKGMLRIKKEMLKKVKTHYLWFRKPMDEESVQFYRDFHVIFFQPNNLTPKREELLESLLTHHPDLKIYRTMTLSLGELSRRPPEEIDGHQIDDLCTSPSFSKKLNTAIKTIKKHRNHILRFVEYSREHPEFLKAQHSSMEYYNKKFKDPFEAGNNLLKKERLLGRLNTQFSGKIEWYLDEEVLI